MDRIDAREHMKAALESRGFTVVTPELEPPMPSVTDLNHAYAECLAEKMYEPRGCKRHGPYAEQPCPECADERLLRQHNEAQQSSRANHYKRQSVPRTRSLPRTTQNR